MASQVLDETQWLTLAMAMPLLQTYVTGGSRGQTMRFDAFKSVCALFFVTPGDLRRAGLEVAAPDEYTVDGQEPASVASMDARRRARLLGKSDG
jgi:hypothetical protein